jgi:hypothetical protein
MLESRIEPGNVEEKNEMNTAGLNGELKALGEALLKRIPVDGITLLPLTSKLSIETIRQSFPSGIVVACDVYVTGIETGVALGTGYEKEGIVNIDHHAPTTEMARAVSSGNLAIEWVTANGPLDATVPIVINHTDCDSVISSLIMRGLLPPHEAFGVAVLAADHTGNENAIADLLQALDPLRDLNFSVRNLGLLLSGQALDAEAERLLQQRLEGRERARQCVSEGRAKNLGPLTLVTLDKKVGGEFFPAIFPDSVVIMSASPHEKNPGHWEVKLRLGQAAPTGFTLFDIGINDVDPGFGGRWNAGSNQRALGTLMDPAEYAKLISEKLSARLRSHVAS